MNTDRIWFRKSPSRRSHHQCGSHAQQQRWKHRGWYWSPRIGSRVHPGCSTDLGTISKDLPSPRSWESCLHPPYSSGQPDDDWSNEGMRCLATIPGCREVAAEGRQHCLLLCTHTWSRSAHYLFHQPTSALVLTSRSGQLGHSCRPLPCPPCPDQQECSRCSRGRTYFVFRLTSVFL